MLVTMRSTSSRTPHSTQDLSLQVTRSPSSLSFLQEIYNEIKNEILVPHHKKEGPRRRNSQKHFITEADATLKSSRPRAKSAMSPRECPSNDTNVAVRQQPLSDSELKPADKAADTISAHNISMTATPTSPSRYIIPGINSRPTWSDDGGSQSPPTLQTSRSLRSFDGYRIRTMCPMPLSNRPGLNHRSASVPLTALDAFTSSLREELGHLSKRKSKSKKKTKTQGDKVSRQHGRDMSRSDSKPLSSNHSISSGVSFSAPMKKQISAHKLLSLASKAQPSIMNHHYSNRQDLTSSPTNTATSRTRDECWSKVQQEYSEILRKQEKLRRKQAKLRRKQEKAILEIRRLQEEEEQDEY